MRALFLVALVVSVPACQSTPPPCVDPSTLTRVPDTSAATRPFLLASAGVQIDRTGFVIGPADIATDDDLFAIHQDFLGLPWDAFEADTAPPPEWVAALDLQAQQVRDTGKGVFLSLQLVGGSGRAYLADRTALRNGKVDKELDWGPRCYDFRTAADGASKRAAYVRYVQYMVEKFQPRFLNVAIEMNLFQVCKDAWPGMVETANAAYDAAKAADPNLVVFPSFVLENLYAHDDTFRQALCGDAATPEACQATAVGMLAGLKRDRFALSVYPSGADVIADPRKLADDYLVRIANQLGERVVIAETGWNSEPVRAQSGWFCQDIVPSCGGNQQAYLSFLLWSAQAYGMDLVTWWSDRDVLTAGISGKCPCDDGSTGCAIVQAWRSAGKTDQEKLFYEFALKAFGTMGLRTFDGQPKSGTYALWHSVHQLPPEQALRGPESPTSPPAR